MEKRDVQPAKSGLDEKTLNDLKSEITALYATLDSAIKHINQHRHSGMQKTESNSLGGGWVYNMTDLADWVHHYTERRRLHCPKCNEDSSKEGVRFVCTECLTEFEYHDEL